MAHINPQSVRETNQIWKKIGNILKYNENSRKKALKQFMEFY